MEVTFVGVLVICVLVFTVFVLFILCFCTVLLMKIYSYSYLSEIV